MDTSLIKLCHKLHTLTKLFRFLELFTILILFSWISTHLPRTLQISSLYFSRFTALLFSSTSIFILGNIIILTLLTKSGLFSTSSYTAVANVTHPEYEHGPDMMFLTEGIVDPVVFQDKEVIFCQEKVPVLVPVSVDEKDEENSGVSFRRSKSEKIKGEKVEQGKLRRSETDICRINDDFAAMEDGDGGGRGGGGEEDSGCNEEFRRTIEEFIAKQVRFHRQESLAVVIHGQA